MTRFVCLLFPHVTQLDLTGPAQVFAKIPETQLHLVWASREPVPTDSGFSIVPTDTWETAPQADVLFVPGGQGVFEVIDDDAVLAFLRSQSAAARYTTSVCTGSFLLGAAGLLTGRRATTHWASLPLLKALGAEPISERVVRDGGLITGAGVTSGIDFALTVAAELHGEETARQIQLLIEYDPAPPFDAGSPGRPEADPVHVTTQREKMAALRGPLVAQAAQRLTH